MKRLLFLLLLLLAQVALATPAPVNSVVNVGANGNCATIPIAYALNTGTANYPQAVALYAGLGNGVTNSFYYGFQSAASPASQTKYQVPSGHVLIPVCVGEFAANASDGEFNLGYSTATFTDGSTPGFTGTQVTYLENVSSTAFTFGAIIPTGASKPGPNWVPVVGISFPALSYPFVNPTSSSGPTSVSVIAILF